MEQLTKIKSMKCPVCGGRLQVIDSRKGEIENNTIVRRRKCLDKKCEHRFSTIEIPKDMFDKLNPRDNRHARLITKIREVLSADIKKYNKKSNRKNTKTV